MGDVLHPKPPQWERRDEAHDIRDDAVLSLTARLMETIQSGVEPDIVVLAAIRMVQKALILNYSRNAGKEATMEALRQATALAAQYEIGGVGPDET